MTVDAYTAEGYHYRLLSTGPDEQRCCISILSIKKKKRSFIFKGCHLLVINALCVIVRNLGLLNDAAINPSI